MSVNKAERFLVLFEVTGYYHFFLHISLSKIWLKIENTIPFLNCVHLHSVLSITMSSICFTYKELNVFLKHWSVTPKYIKIYQHFELYMTLPQKKRELMLKAHGFLYILQSFCYMYWMDNEKRCFLLMKNVREWRIETWRRKMRMLTTQRIIWKNSRTTLSLFWKDINAINK